MSYTKPAWIEIIATALALAGVPPLSTHRFPDEFIFKKFRTAAGSASMNVAGNITPVVFFVEAPSAMFVERVNMTFTDGSITPNKFAGVGALGTGMRVYLTDKADVELLDFLDGDTITTNREFALLAGVDNIIHPAAGDDQLPIRWTLAKAGAKLRLNTGDRLVLLVQDDLTGITFFEAMLQGIRI